MQVDYYKNNVKLWEDWLNHYKTLEINPLLISKDGALNPDKYFSSPIRILFILKDTNDYAGGDLASLLKNGPVYQMWHVLARWASGLMRSFPAYEEINNWEEMCESLWSVSVINLKKITGKSTAQNRDINVYAYRDRELLRRQIELLNPQLIVSCGVIDPLVWLLELDIKSTYDINFPVFSNVHQAWVLSFRHPARATREHYEELQTLSMKNEMFWEWLKHHKR